MKTKFGIVRLYSGLFQGIIEGDILCFVVRNNSQEAIQDAKELLGRYNNDNQIR